MIDRKLKRIKSNQLKINETEQTTDEEKWHAHFFKLKENVYRVRCRETENDRMQFK